jgi:hypothetical protein
MIELTREQILDTLQHGWGTYVERFQRLSSKEQAAFLTKQGYARFADLLAHVIAWWEEGKLGVENLLVDPDFNSPNYEVDAFNAQAVQRFSQLDELTVIQSFESMRGALLDFVTSLPEDAFQNNKIVERLYIEVLDHLKEHEIPE